MLECSTRYPLLILGSIFLGRSTLPIILKCETVYCVGATEQVTSVPILSHISYVLLAGVPLLQPRYCLLKGSEGLFCEGD